MDDQDKTEVTETNTILSIEELEAIEKELAALSLEKPHLRVAKRRMHLLMKKLDHLIASCTEVRPILIPNDGDF